MFGRSLEQEETGLLLAKSIRAYRLRVWSYCKDLQRETDPTIRANTALYLAEAAAVLARLELDEAKKGCS
jgi:hypothetical protein